MKRLAPLLVALAAGASWAQSHPLVMIDPGHGGKYDGALSPSGWREKDLTLELAVRIGAELERTQGAKVVFTRDRDRHTSFADRVALANAQQPDVFISIHANATATAYRRETTKGIATYFSSLSAVGESARATADRENADSEVVEGAPQDSLSAILTDLKVREANTDSSRLAQALQRRLIAATGATDRGVHQAPLAVLSGIQAPSALIEVGYISNASEAKKLATAAYQEKLAAAVALGIGDFLVGIRNRDVRR